MYYKCIGVRRKLQTISCTQFQAYLAKDNFCTNLGDCVTNEKESFIGF